MIFPIGDDNRDRTITPYVNYLFIALNIFVFAYLQGCGTNADFTYRWSTVPAEILSGNDIVTDDEIFEDPLSGDKFRMPGLQPTPISVYLTLFTSMFMHGGFGHILGNMFFLFVFGDNIENRLGHFRYLIFYLLVGVLASLAHVFSSAALDMNLLIPSLGASGAISGVLGAYILLYPGRRVNVVMFYIITAVPAFVALGLWFVFQLISGLGMLGGGSQAGGVAYAAHIGGFIAGLILIKFFDIGKKRKIKRW
jgi:membrane associated rhomboid family serine protease